MFQVVLFSHALLCARMNVDQTETILSQEPKKRTRHIRLMSPRAAFPLQRQLVTVKGKSIQSEPPHPALAQTLLRQDGKREALLCLQRPRSRLCKRYMNGGKNKYVEIVVRSST